ncbi:MAG: hypothetical protein HKN25_11385, partial [Pyrinomonadaceae bacterium]|nr:hypothetical protein [Pyrinomonadaceae bacterium]
ADLRAPTPSAAAELVAESEDRIEAEIRQRTQSLYQLVEYKLLKAKNDLQRLALSTAFTEFRQTLRDRQYAIGDSKERMTESILEGLRLRVKKFESLKQRISPIKLSSNLGTKRTRLAVLDQRNISVVKRIVASSDEMLKTRMASLDALSPLAVLDRGFSVTENKKGEILRDSSSVNQNDEVKIRLAKGNINARVINTDKE